MYSTTLPQGRYAMLLRKSREDEEAERRGRYETLAYHEQMLTDVAARHGITIAHDDVFRELASGESLSNCPICTALLQAVARGDYAGVLVREPSRLTRGDLTDMGKVIASFQFSGTLIVTPYQILDLSNPYDLRAIENDLMDGRRELGWIKERMRESKLQRVREGQYLAANAPWGWRKIVLPDKRKTIEPDKNNAMAVKWFHDGVSGRIASAHSVVEDLNRRGILTPNGGTWTTTMWKELMGNPVWKGYVRWNGKKVVQELGEDFIKRKRRVRQEPLVFKGIHEGTVPEEVFDEFQRVFNIRTMPKTRADAVTRNPFSGIMRCSECGRVMRRSISDGKERLDHATANRHECWQVSSLMDVVLEEVTESLRDLVRDFEMEPDTANGKAIASARVNELYEAMEERSKALTNMMRLAQKGLITDEEFAQQRRAIDAQREELEEQLRIAEKEANEAMTAEERACGLRHAIELLTSDEATPEETNAALKAVVKRIDYAKDETEGLRLKVFLR